MRPSLLIRGVAATSANACPFRNPALAGRTLEGVVKKGSDNPADGTEKEAQIETGTGVVFSASTKVANPAHEKRPESNHDRQANQEGDVIVIRVHKRNSAPLPEDCQARF